MLDVVLLISSYEHYLIWLKLMSAFVLIVVVCQLTKYGLRRISYKEKELKAAGLNHHKRRAWRAVERRKRRRGGRELKRIVHHY